MKKEQSKIPYLVFEALAGVAGLGLIAYSLGFLPFLGVFFCLWSANTRMDWKGKEASKDAVLAVCNAIKSKQK